MRVSRVFQFKYLDEATQDAGLKKIANEIDWTNLYFLNFINDRKIAKNSEWYNKDGQFIAYLDF